MFRCQKRDLEGWFVSRHALPHGRAPDMFASSGGGREFSRHRAAVDQGPFSGLGYGGLENRGEVIDVKEQRFRIKRTIQINVTKRDLVAGQWQTQGPESIRSDYVDVLKVAVLPAPVNMTITNRNIFHGTIFWGQANDSITQFRMAVTVQLHSGINKLAQIQHLQHAIKSFIQC